MNTMEPINVYGHYYINAVYINRPAASLSMGIVFTILTVLLLSLFIWRARDSVR